MESSATFVPLFLANNKIAENKQMDVRKKKLKTEDNINYKTGS